MKRFNFIGIVFCLVLASCSDPPPTISDAQAKQACMAFIAKSGIATNNPVLVMEKTDGDLRIFKFMTNGVLSDSQIVVDRVTGVATLKEPSPF